MILGIMEELEKISNKFRNYIIKHDDPFTMLALFLGLLAFFIIGWNMLHKND